MLGSRASAEDVLQDSFVEVIRKSSDFRGDGDIRGWIKRIAINKCLSHLRSPWVSRQTRNAGEFSGEGEPGMAGTLIAQTTDGHATRLARQQELARALAMLSATARSVVWLHDVEGYTHQEIGQLMGRSTSFSKTQLARAYERLRQLLSDEDTDNEAEPCLGILKTV
jgi:RNA polymerase sigma factor (sigma-70 family)